jgi:hypothetical protein
VADDPYTDPVTGVLLSKLGLGTAPELDAAEREITHAALILLGESPVHPGYDLPHLCAIHRRIFGDIYDWAGQIRTVAIAKGSLFCLPQYIEPSAAEIFRALRSENFLRDLDREAFVARLAYYLGEVNAPGSRARPISTGSASTELRSGTHVSTGGGNMLVAPMRVGDGAYAAVGSVLTASAANSRPPNSLTSHGVTVH